MTVSTYGDLLDWLYLTDCKGGISGQSKPSHGAVTATGRLSVTR
jgi:hypothetical protein